VLSRMGAIDWSDAVARIRSEVFARLRHHSINFENQIVNEQVLTPVDWRNQFGLYDGSAFGAAHTLRQIGPFRSRNWSSTHRGLYYVGASTTPGTGMPMVVLGGKMTAERIQSHVH